MKCTKTCATRAARLFYLKCNDGCVWCNAPVGRISAFLSVVWLAKWCKIHKVYIHSHSRLLLLFTNIFIHIQQLSLHSRNIFVYIQRHISYSRIYLLTFTGCIHSHSTSYIRSHSRSKYSFNTVQYSFNTFCALPLRIIRSRAPTRLKSMLTRSSYRNCRLSYVWGWSSFVEKAPVLPTDC